MTLMDPRRQLRDEPHTGSSPRSLIGSIHQAVLACRLDALLVLSILCYQNWTLVATTVALHLKQIQRVVLALGIIWRCSQALRAYLKLTPIGTTPRWTGHGQPMIFPGRTTHSRLFPKKHSFSYSYLLVGVPVDWAGVAGEMVSSGVDKPAAVDDFMSWLLLGSRKSGWLHIDPADHLESCITQQTLRQKLDAYLEFQGDDPAKYPHAYLVTAPKFLGYNFNPVSFWYLYGPDKALAAMILEVNNTFGERRPYLLIKDIKPQLNGENDDGENGDDNDISRSRADGESTKRTAFTNAWDKDFHVSPFNSRKGSYTLTAYDPWEASPGTARGIELTIVLRSSKSHGKLVARVIPDGEALDPQTMGPREKLKFLLAWCWVGFATFPRILKEAALLFWKRKLHVWIRPEPLKESMGRDADKTEEALEAAFRTYLRYLVQQCSKPVALTYIPGRVSGASKELMLSPSSVVPGLDNAVKLEFRVLTPLFFSRFACYAHDLEALFCESQESCTIHISKPEFLPYLVFKKPSPTVSLSNGLDFLLFKAIHYLRRRPERIRTPMILFSNAQQPVEETYHSPVDIRGFRISSMDGFMLTEVDTGLRRQYAAAVLKLFLADRVALGMVPLLDAQIFILRLGLAAGIAKLLQNVVLRRFV